MDEGRGKADGPETGEALPPPVPKKK